MEHKTKLLVTPYQMACLYKAGEMIWAAANDFVGGDLDQKTAIRIIRYWSERIMSETKIVKGKDIIIDISEEE